MNQETKTTIGKYAVCVAIELVIAFIVIWINGFFTESMAVNIQILADAFFTAGLLMTLFAGMMYVSSEGALIGISYVLRSAVLIFIPMGRLKQEKYIDYRERKLSAAKNNGIRHVLITGLVFVFVGIVFTLIWNAKFYNA